MSVDLDVYLDSSALPTVLAWEKAISAERFRLSFQQGVDLTKLGPGDKREPFLSV